MPSRSRTAASVLAMLIALMASAVIGVTRLGSAGAVESAPRGIAIMRLGSSWTLASNYDKYSYVIVGRSAAAAAASQPGMSLVYHSGTSVNVNWDTGVPYSVASANGWLLRDASGNLLKNLGYPDNYIGDVGSAAYQAEWARRVGDYLASVGADGVYIDDVIADISTMSGVFPAKYPNQPAWENAMASFVDTIGKTLKARGFYVLLNAHKFVSGNLGSNDGSLEAEWWRRLGPSVSGLHNEFFMQIATNKSYLRGEGSAWYDNWSGWANLITVAQSTGADFFGMTYGSTSNVQAMRYVRATQLLFWDGDGGALLYQVDSGDPWSPEWTIDVGTPVGGRYQVGVGWRRQYSGGTVLVNPNTSSSQTFSLGGTYLMPDGTPASSVTLAPKNGLVLRSSTTTPVNTALPTVSGTPQQGVLLASTTGTWSGTPTSYGYQWNRCDTSGAACAAISGATTAQYLLGAADLGKTIRVKVTATNASGSASATSNATAVVVPPPPANVTLPSISGTAQEGQTLSASPGTWTNSPTSYRYQWQRCDSGGNACAAVAGATAATFVLTSTDVGKTLRVVVTATNAGGSAQATSAASAVVGGAFKTVAPPANTSPPTISGTAQHGKTLTAQTGSWSNSPTSYAYQWRRCDSGGGSCVAIAGATGSSLTLGSEDVGHTVRVAVTASNTAGSATATSAASAVVAPAALTSSAPVNIALPTLSGTAQEGETLSTSTGSWSNSPTSYAYQWRRCDASGSGCADIGGANGSQYALTSSDVGRTVRVVVTASNTAGSSSATSAASAAIAPALAPPPPPVTNMGLPNVTGPERVGKTVDTSSGSWDGNPTSFAYQWLRCSTEQLVSCIPIQGATRASYTIVDDDLDRYVIVKVTASSATGSDSATSKFGRPIKG